MLFYGNRRGVPYTQSQQNTNQAQNTIQGNDTHRQTNSIRGLGSRIRARLRGQNIPVSAQRRDRNGFFDMRRIVPGLRTRLRIGLFLVPGLIALRIVSFLSSRGNKTHHTPSQHQSNTKSSTDSSQNSSLRPERPSDNGSHGHSRNIHFPGELTSTFIYDPDEPIHTDTTSITSLDSNDSSVSSLTSESSIDDSSIQTSDYMSDTETSSLDEQNSSNTAVNIVGSDGSGLEGFIEQRNGLVATARRLLDEQCNGNNTMVLNPEADLGEGVFSVAGTNLLLQEGISHQAAMTCIFFKDVLTWLCDLQATYQNRPRSLEHCTEADCRTMRDHRALLLQALPQVYGVRQRGDGTILVVTENVRAQTQANGVHAQATNSSGVFDVELGPEEYNLEELHAHHHSGGLYSSLQLRIHSFLGRNSTPSLHRVVQPNSTQRVGVGSIFTSRRRQRLSRLLEKFLTALSKNQQTSIQQQVSSIQTAVALLPFAGWGMRLRFVFPDHGDTSTTPRVTLSSFDHTVFASETDISLDGEISRGAYASARSNVMEGLQSVLENLSKIN